MGAYINAFFGSNVTHVCNAYSRSDFVWLMFTSSQINIKIQFDISYKPSLAGESYTTDVSEFIRVPYGEHIRKERSKAYEYLTVFIQGEGNEAVNLCVNWEIVANRSYIITNSGKVTPKKKGGEYSLWLDESGVDHEPRK